MMLIMIIKMKMITMRYTDNMGEKETLMLMMIEFIKMMVTVMLRVTLISIIK